MIWMIRRLLPLVLVVACTAGRADEDSPSSSGSGAASASVVDSVVPISVALDRFRAGLEQPGGLHGNVIYRDTLVRLVMQALEESDTLAFEQIAVNRAEWAWLYYPTNILAQPPYELPPALAWFQLQETSRKGVFRALREYGDQKLDYRGYRCDPQPTIEDQNRLWTNCIVTVARAGEPSKDVRLFGAILERTGHFAILSYDNDF